MNSIKLIVSIFFIMSFFSCSQIHKEIDSSEVQSAFILNSSATFKGYFYQGTDTEFHYFVSKWDIEKDRHFKLKKEDLIIDSPYDFKINEVRIDVIKTNKKFGSNEFYTLYNIE